VSHFRKMKNIPERDGWLAAGRRGRCGDGDAATPGSGSGSPGCDSSYDPYR
jgi:hypothetical protein